MPLETPRLDALQRHSFTLLGYEWLWASTTWDKLAAIEQYAPGYYLKDIRFDIEIIGAGASGTKPGTSKGGYGGAPGGVTFIEKIHPSEIPDSVAVIIGAGGAAVTSGAIANAGGDTSFGDFVGYGGRGINPFYPNLAAASLLPPSDIALGAAGEWSTGYVNPTLSSGAPSFGPSGGGAGAWTSGAAAGGSDGGISGARRATSKRSGGIASTASAPAGNGQTADGAYDFGSGGGGGNSQSGVQANMNGATGGAPGGGGGGGGGNNNTTYGNGGAGANGAVRIRIYVWKEDE